MGKTSWPVPASPRSATRFLLRRQRGWTGADMIPFQWKITPEITNRGSVPMSWFGLLAIAVALALDAFAVAVVAGLSLKVLTKRHLFRLSFHFGLFQALMLAAGWLIWNAVYA